MTVIKIYPEKNFTTLHNENIWDSNLSNETVGFWARCVSMKADWEFYVVDIAKRMKCSKKNAYKHIKILQENRYCLRFDCYEKRGSRFTNKIVKYVFFMRPFQESERQGLEDELKKSFRNAHLGDLHVGSLQTETLTKKNISNSLEDLQIEEKKKEEQKGPPTPNHVFSCGKVEMPQADYNSICQEHTQTKVDEYINKLNDYAKINPKKFNNYACHATVISVWIKRDKEEKKPNKVFEKRVDRSQRKADGTLSNPIYLDLF